MSGEADAWEQELAVLRTVIGAQTGRPPEDPEVRRMATGIALISTLSTPDLELALGHLQQDVERRRKVAGG